MECNGAAQGRTASIHAGNGAGVSRAQLATSGTTTIETSNVVFNQVLCRSMADLFMLMTTRRRDPIRMPEFPGIRRRSGAMA